MSRQGRALCSSEIQTIVVLLRSTDTPIPAIAERMGCSRSAIVAINRKFQVREYRGRRNTWETLCAPKAGEKVATGE